MKVMQDVRGVDDFQGPFPMKKKTTWKERLLAALILTAFSMIMTMMVFSAILKTIEIRENQVNDKYNISERVHDGSQTTE